jgi:hypothetical protein
LFVGFGHEFDDATDEPKSVTSRRESQQWRSWSSDECRGNAGLTAAAQGSGTSMMNR